METLEDLETILSEMPVPRVIAGPHKARLKASLVEAFGKKRRIALSWRILVTAACLLLAVSIGVYFMLYVETSKVFAATIRALANVRTMRCEITVESAEENPRHDTIYWIAPDKLRMDFGGEEFPIHETRWVEADKLTVLNHKDKSAVVTLHASPENAPILAGVSQTAIPDGLIDLLKREKVRDIVQTTTDGVEVFTIRPHGEDVRYSTELTLNSKSQLPVEMRQSILDRGVVTIQRFAWNVDIATELMTPSIPEDIKPLVLDLSQNAFPFDVRPGDGIGPAKLNMTKEELIAVLGKPDAVPDFGLGNILCYYRYGIEVFLNNKNSKVQWLSCVLRETMAPPYKTFMGKTKEGIGIGSTEEEIIAAFGQPDRRLGQPTRGHEVIGLWYYKKGMSFDLQAGWVKGWGEEAKVISIQVRAWK
jgi:hypothetical protein